MPACSRRPKSRKAARLLTFPSCGCETVSRAKQGPPARASFSFLYLKKIQKYMSVLKNFENAPRSLGLGATGVLSPKQRATGPQYNFFLNLQRGPWPGVGGLSPPQGRQGSPTLYKAWPPFPSHLSPKIQKKERGEERKAAKLCRIPHL